MHHHTRQVLFTTAVLICCLSFLFCAVTSRATTTYAAEATKLSFQATANTGNSTITNVLTVSTNGISIGSPIEVNGTATIGTKPLAAASVALHMGDVVLATTTTDNTGQYSFSTPVGLDYFPSAMWGGAAVYTVVKAPAGLSDATSNVTDVPVDPLPFYALIIVIVAIVLVVLQAYSDRFTRYLKGFRGKAKPPKT
jgi:hypothetical protein